MKISLANIGVFHDYEIIRTGFYSFFMKYQDKFNLCAVSDTSFLIELELENLDLIIVPSAFFKEKKYNHQLKRALDMNVHIIVLGEYSDSGSINFFLSSGAKCYLKENEKLDVIYRSIKIVCQGSLYCPYDISFNTYNQKSLKPTFTERELEVFNLLRQEFTNLQVAEKLGVHPKTIEYHRKNIIEKCDAKKLLGALDYLITQGHVPISNQ